MARRVDPLKAKAARQKKIAIGLCVLLVGVLAIQGPKMLKLFKGPQAAAAETTAPAVPAPTSPVTPATPGVATPATPSVASPDAQPPILASSDLPLAGPGQLESFELFESKDPFTQQVDPDAAVATPPGAGAAKPAPPKKDAEPKADAPGSSGGATPPTVEPAAPPTPPTPARPATATTISVNGVPAVAAVDQRFPAEDPIFVLVSTAPDGKSVEIGIAGGTYADGKDTITLKLGKKLTLQNTADGSRYDLELMTVAGFVTPDK